MTLVVRAAEPRVLEIWGPFTKTAVALHETIEEGAVAAAARRGQDDRGMRTRDTHMGTETRSIRVAYHERLDVVVTTSNAPEFCW